MSLMWSVYLDYRDHGLLPTESPSDQTKLYSRGFLIVVHSKIHHIKNQYGKYLPDKNKTLNHG